MVEDPDTGNTCWGSIIVEDKIGPSCLSVFDYAVDCVEGLPSDTDPNYFPAFEDNCEVAIINLVSESVLNDDICTDIVVERIWSATDASGNASLDNCAQLITISRATLQLPSDIDFSCSDYDLENLVPALTGEIEGVSTACMYSFTYADVVVAGCGASQTITRTWTLLDMCNSDVTTHVQIIKLIDTEGPSINLMICTCVVTSLLHMSNSVQVRVIVCEAPQPATTTSAYVKLYIHAVDTPSISPVSAGTKFSRS
jgi:hypothetical protein